VPSSQTSDFWYSFLPWPSFPYCNWPSAICRWWHQYWLYQTFRREKCHPAAQSRHSCHVFRFSLHSMHSFLGFHKKTKHARAKRASGFVRGHSCAPFPFRTLPLRHPQCLFSQLNFFLRWWQHLDFPWHGGYYGNYCCMALPCGWSYHKKHKARATRWKSDPP
jgi:hypothetical protein